PAIGEDLHLVAPGIDHRLDGEEHAFAQHRALARTAEMHDGRRVVEHPADAVAAEIAHHREPVAFGEALNRVADIADRGAGLHHGDAAHHRLIGHLDQAAGLQGDAVADEIHAAGIAMPAIEDDGDV